MAGDLWIAGEQGLVLRLDAAGRRFRAVPVRYRGSFSLPVIAVGVGLGVDYALYYLSVQLAHQRAGLPLAEAHRRTLRFTGRVVALVGCTLAAGVLTWAWSPIKLQADMGILLTFMFLGNMGGALVLMPALSRFLLEPAPAGGAAGRP